MNQNQPDLFLAATAAHYGADTPDALATVTDQPAVEAPRVVVEDPAHLTTGEVDALVAGFRGRFGVVAFECRGRSATGTHPLIAIGNALRDRIPSRWPVRNAGDLDDGTTKIHDAGPGDDKPRALSTRALAAHQDGWVSLRGVLAVTGLCADSAPPRSPATYVQNVVRVAVDLWRYDEQAFRWLFRDDAVAVTRRSDGHRVTSPVLELVDGEPRAFFRAPNDEYDVAPGSSDPAAARAVEFLVAHTGPDAPGSTFTRLDAPGRGFLLDNRRCVHGRTGFADGDGPGDKRVIASKWWTADDRYRDVHWGAADAMAGIGGASR